MAAPGLCQVPAGPEIEISADAKKISTLRSSMAGGRDDTRDKGHHCVRRGLNGVASIH
jgi:hypothetical protein